MKRRILIGLLVALGLLWALPAGDLRAQEGEEPASPAVTVEPDPAPEPRPVRRHGEQVSVFGSAIRVSADTERWGDVIAIGSDVVVEGRVRGQIVIIGGDLELTGRVSGDVVGILSNLDLSGADVGGQLLNIGGTFREESSIIDEGTVNLPLGGNWLGLSRPFGVLGAVMFWCRLIRLLIVFVLVLLLVALVPERVRVISEETPNRIFAAFFVGLLGYLAFWIVFVLALATVVGAPLAWLLFVVFKWLGITGMFHFLGQRLGRSLGREMSMLGAVLVGFAPYLLIVLLPSAFGLAGLIVAAVFSMLIWIFLEIPAVGLAILTRAGGRPSPAVPAMVGGGAEVPPTPPAPTAPAAPAEERPPEG
jgi:hypothetical protein